MQHVEREVELPSPPAEVWQAVIDPVRLGDWLGGDLDVTLRPGWCLMQSRFVIGGMAAVPQGPGTLFAGCGGLRLPGGRLLVAAVGGDRGAQRVVRRLRENCGG